MIGWCIVSNLTPNNLAEEISPRTFCTRIKFYKRFFLFFQKRASAESKTKQNETKRKQKLMPDTVSFKSIKNYIFGNKVLPKCTFFCTVLFV